MTTQHKIRSGKSEVINCHNQARYRRSCGLQDGVRWFRAPNVNAWKRANPSANFSLKSIEQIQWSFYADTWRWMRLGITTSILAPNYIICNGGMQIHHRQ